MIYRIADTQDCEAAQASGYFASADLAAEGFIPCKLSQLTPNKLKKSMT